MSGPHSFGDKKDTIYPFYKSNIHEKRIAAYVCRAIPFACLIFTLLLLLIGVWKHTMVLLVTTAILNVVLWLWLVVTALMGINGTFAVKENLKIWEGPAAVVGNTGTVESQDRPGHLIVLPNYQEDEDMMLETLQNLKEADGHEHFVVILAMEEREEEAEAKANKLKAAHQSSFKRLEATFHPKDLPEIHHDGTYNAEVPGKASNLKYAVAEANKMIPRDAADSTILTVADADVFFHPSYFKYVETQYKILKEEGNGHEKWTLYQAPQLCWRNFWESPVVSRTWGYISSLYEFGGVSGLRWGAHHMVFSAYSMPLKLATDASSFDGDVIAEDHHTYLKSWFYSVYKTEVDRENGDHNQYAHSKIRVHPVMLPVKSTSVNSADGWWATWAERWHQATRHTQGSAEISYACLATWDLLTTVSVWNYSPSFILNLVKVVFRPFFMHLIPTLESLSLGVLTLKWIINDFHVPGCPKHLTIFNIENEKTTVVCGLAGAWALTWPVVIPFVLLIVTNYLMISTSFFDQAKKKTLWHDADGGVKPFTFCAGDDAATDLEGAGDDAATDLEGAGDDAATDLEGAGDDAATDLEGAGDDAATDLEGSRRVSTLILIALDASLFLGPIMVVYGCVAECISYWNVMVRGNNFKYITASKALGNNYGSISEVPGGKTA